MIEAKKSPDFRFLPGTMVMTDEGSQPVEWLEAGVRIVTRDHGLQRLRKVRRTEWNPGDFKAPGLVRFSEASLDGSSPEQEISLFADHPVLFRSAVAELWFAEREVFVQASCYRDDVLVHADHPVVPVTVTTLQFDQHEIISVEGAWVGSSLPTQNAFWARPCLTQAEAEILIAPLRASPLPMFLTA